MVIFSTPFGGQQELTLIGAEQTTSLLVVMIGAYLFVWVATLVIFWCLLDGTDAMGFALLFLYILIPVTTFVVSLLIGKNAYWGHAKWFAPLVFGVIHMLTEYATFSMRNMIQISFSRINAPHFELFLVGAGVSAIGLGIGTAIRNKKNKC